MLDSNRWLSNKELFRIHGWLGLNLGLLLFIVCFSGTIAVFSHEIDWLLDPAMRVEDAGGSVDWEAIRTGVEEAYPLHTISFMVGPRHSGFAALAYAESPSGTFLKLYVNPYTGEVQGRNSFWNVQRFFRSFHRRMFFPGTYGIVWVTFFSLVLGVSIITGILFYKGWYRNLLRLRTRNWRLFFSDGHRLAGVSTFVFSVVFVITGLWYTVERFSPPPDVPGPELENAELAQRGPHPEVLDLNDIVARASRAHPDLEAKAIIVRPAWQAVEVRGQSKRWLVRDRANRVLVDPVSGEVTAVQKASELSLYHGWSDMADPLHFGTFGGLWTQVIWFVAGLLISTLMLTGGWLWLRRSKKKVRLLFDTPEGSRQALMYLSLVWPVLILIGSTYFGYHEARDYIGYDTDSAYHVGGQTVGPWTFDLVRLGDVVPGARLALKWYGSPAEGRLHYKQARLKLLDEANDVLREWTPEPGNPLRATPILPDESLSDLTLELSVETWDGQVHESLRSMASLRGGRLVDGPIQAPDVPWPVWAVIVSFIVCTGAITGAWVYYVGRATVDRAEAPGQNDVSSSIPRGNGAAVKPVRIDRP